jgi:hypothetical protein
MKRVSIYIAFVLIMSVSACKKAEEKTIDKNEVEKPAIEQPAIVQESKPEVNRTEETDTEGVKNLPEVILKFVPKGFTVINITSGNLNLDEYSDTILVLKENNEEASNEEINRPLLLLLGQPDGNFKLEKRNNRAIFCFACGGIGGDPFVGITIKNGYFSIEHGVHGGQHWDDVTTFKYDKVKINWFLYKEGYESYKMNDSQDPNAEALVLDVKKQATVKDFGIISFDNFDIYKRAEQR